MSGTVKVKCSCEHEFQDKQYGRGVRIANKTAKGDKDNQEARCTVCSRVLRISRNEKVKS